MRILFLVTTAIAFIIVVNADDKVSKNATKADTIKTKDTRGKRNLNLFGNFDNNSNRRNYNYQPNGYNYEPSNFIGGGSAPDRHHLHHHQYPEPPEPIIEIIIQDSNDTLPEPQPLIQSNGKKKKEQVQVFYVKYHKDEKNGLVIHDPVAALSPAGHEQNEHEDDIHDEPIIVTPLPNIPRKSTTLRTIIRPESEQYESNSGVHVTFNHPHNHNSKSDNNIIHDEDKLESAIQPVVQLPQNRIGPLQVAPLERPSQHVFPSIVNQGRVVNSPPSHSNGNFHHPPQQLVQPLPHQRPALEFNPQNNFVSHPQQGVLNNQLSLPSHEPSKPFHPQFHQAPNHHHQQQQHRPQGPPVIPINHQQQFNNQQLGHQQFNQPPQRIPQPGPIGAPNSQHQTVLKPPQRPAIPGNFNQNQKPFNYHAFPTQPQQTRFPPNQQNHNPPQFHQNQPQFQQNQPQFQQNPNIQHHQGPPQRPPQHLGPRPNGIPPPPPQSNIHNPSQQLLPFNRPPVQFNAPQFPQQQLPLHQPPQNFKPEQTRPQVHHSQPLHQHNQFAAQQNAAVQHNIHQQQQSHNPNVFQGGLVEQAAPNLSQSRPHFNQPQFQTQDDVQFHQQQNKFIQSAFGATDVQVSSSVPKYEHHITETVNPPVFFHSKAVDMEKINAEKNIGPLAGNIGHLQVTQQPKLIAAEQHHRFNVNPQGSVSNHFSQVFQQSDNNQQQYQSVNYVNLDPRNNFSPEHRAQPAIKPTTTIRPTTTQQTTTERSTTTKKPSAYFDLPDEIPDDLRKQLEESGVLENAQISILDYDKIGETPLQDLPPEHLANFFSAGGGAQIGASNKVISVLKPNGESVDDKIEALQGNKDVAKLLSNAGKLPSKKEDVNLKVVTYDAQSNVEKYVQKDAMILPTMNIKQNFSRYLPIKINGAHFPIPDVEELRGKKISSVVVLAPVSQDNEEIRFERNVLENKHIKFLSGDIFKNVIKKPSSENFKKWLEKEQKSNPDSQSVVLLVTKDSTTNEQQIFMYDIPTKSVNRLSGELSSKFVDVAEDNANAEDANGSLITEQIDRIDENIEDDEYDSEPEPSNIEESVASLDDESPVEEENKVLISSGYSVIKNE
ncbi:hypothetical protein ACKWTF_003531 [Chironomus riparius]